MKEDKNIYAGIAAAFIAYIVSKKFPRIEFLPYLILFNMLLAILQNFEITFQYRYLSWSFVSFILIIEYLNILKVEIFLIILIRQVNPLLNIYFGQENEQIRLVALIISFRILKKFIGVSKETQLKKLN
jgi:hypothetical protein